MNLFIYNNRISECEYIFYGGKLCLYVHTLCDPVPHGYRKYCTVLGSAYLCKLPTCLRTLETVRTLPISVISC